MSKRAKLLPVLALAMLVGCSPSQSEDQAQKETRRPPSRPPAPAIAAAPDAPAELPSPRPTRPGRPPVAAVEDLPADDPEVESYPPPVLQPLPPEQEQGYQPMDLPPSNAAASVEAFPDEVTAFMVERDSCDHFRGEEPYDADRRAYIEESIAELCTGTDAKLAALRRRYADNPAVIQALGNYEDRIERPSGRKGSAPPYVPFLSQ